MITVLFFGPVQDRIGSREIAVDFSAGLCLQDVITQLTARYPQVFDIISLITVNEVQTRDMQTPLHDHDVLAFMAKFSGG